jgi:hypothetical protein
MTPHTTHSTAPLIIIARPNSRLDKAGFCVVRGKKMRGKKMRKREFKIKSKTILTRDCLLSAIVCFAVPQLPVHHFWRPSYLRSPHLTPESSTWAALPFPALNKIKTKFKGIQRNQPTPSPPSHWFGIDLIVSLRELLHPLHPPSFNPQTGIHNTKCCLSDLNLIAPFISVFHFLALLPTHRIYHLVLSHFRK